MKKKICVLMTAVVCALGGCGMLDQETEQQVREELKNAAAEAGDVLRDAQAKVSEELSQVNWAELIFEPDEEGEKKSLKVLYESAGGQWTEVEDMEDFRKQIDAGGWEKTDAVPDGAEEGVHFSIQQKGTIHLGEEDTDRYYEIAEMTLYGEDTVTLTILGDITQYLDVVIPQESFTASYTISREAAEYLRAFGA